MNKSKLYTVFLVGILVVGLSLLLYPSFSEYWNSVHQTQAIASYLDMVDHLGEEDYSEIWDSASDYNMELLNRDVTFVLTEEQKQQYNALLNLTNSGIMGYIEIPSINVHLPLYHSTEESVLQKAVGHLDWTSLPVGGPSTHSVFSGHRGLPSARLFTDLDQLAVGDFFMLHILDETLTYEVDRIRIVLPDETDDLLIQKGKDLCTLFTCTPYGINSHRLLVRGHRVENLAEAQVVRVTADAMIVEKLVVAPFVLLPILFVMFIWLLITTRRRK